MLNREMEDHLLRSPTTRETPLVSKERKEKWKKTEKKPEPPSPSRKTHCVYAFGNAEKKVESTQKERQRSVKLLLKNLESG